MKNNEKYDELNMLLAVQNKELLETKAELVRAKAELAEKVIFKPCSEVVFIPKE